MVKTGQLMPANTRLTGSGIEHMIYSTPGEPDLLRASPSKPGSPRVAIFRERLEVGYVVEAERASLFRSARP